MYGAVVIVVVVITVLAELVVSSFAARSYKKKSSLARQAICLLPATFATTCVPAVIIVATFSHLVSSEQAGRRAGRPDSHRINREVSLLRSTNMHTGKRMELSEESTSLF